MRHSGPRTGQKRDPRRAYRVVDQFEEELADYTGAPFVVTVDSCTNALFLSLLYEHENLITNYKRVVRIPRRTYIGVGQAARNAGFCVGWRDEWDHAGWYRIHGCRVIDSARHLGRGMYQSGRFVCLSFHAAKQLPLGRGGAILTDSEDAYEWLRRARTDGRAPGDVDPYATFPGYHMYMPPDVAARGLWILSRWNDSGFEPAPLVPEIYPDLSAIAYEASSKPSGATSERMTVKP